MPPRWQRLNDTKQLTEMRALAAAYDGPVTRLPPGPARGHEVHYPIDIPPRHRADHPKQLSEVGFLRTKTTP